MDVTYAIIAIALNCLILISNFNYSRISSWSVSIPPRDIMPILQYANSPENIDYKEISSELLSALFSTYFRNELLYMENIGQSTIIIEPVLGWDLSGGQFSLNEAIFNFTTKTKQPQSQVVQNIGIRLSGNEFEAAIDVGKSFRTSRKFKEFSVNFINQFYNKARAEIVREIKFLITSSQVMIIGDFIILITSICATMMLMVLLYCSQRRRSLLHLNLAFSCAAIAFSASAVSSMMNMIVCMIAGLRYPNSNFISLILVYIPQSVYYTIGLIVLWKYRSQKSVRIKDELLMATFQPSPEESVASSVYSEIETIDIEQEKRESTDYEDVSLDPLAVKRFDVSTSRLSRTSSYIVKRTQPVAKYPFRCATAPIQMDDSTSSSDVDSTPRIAKLNPSKFRFTEDVN